MEISVLTGQPEHFLLHEQGKERHGLLTRLCNSDYCLNTELFNTHFLCK